MHTIVNEIRIIISANIFNYNIVHYIRSNAINLFNKLEVLKDTLIRSTSNSIRYGLEEMSRKMKKGEKVCRKIYVKKLLWKILVENLVT